MNHKTRLEKYLVDRAINSAHLSPSMDALMTFTCESLDIMEKKLARQKRRNNPTRMDILKQKNGGSV